MASLVAKIVGKKILGETIANKFGKEDPYFETVPATRLDGKPSTSGRTKRRKKALPPGLSVHDGQILTKVKRRAYRLDMCLFTFLGIKFGWGSVIGIIPFIGDAFDAFLAIMVMKTCNQIEGGLPATIRTQMMINIIIDFVLGLVPFLGDIADAAFRANTRNAILLEEHLRQKGKKTLQLSGQPVNGSDPSNPDEYDRWLANGGDQSPIPSRQPSTRSPRNEPADPVKPKPTEARASKSWWNRSRQQDEEMGQAGDAPTSSRKKSQRDRRH